MYGLKFDSGKHGNLEIPMSEIEDCDVDSHVSFLQIPTSNYVIYLSRLHATSSRNMFGALINVTELWSDRGDPDLSSCGVSQMLDAPKKISKTTQYKTEVPSFLFAPKSTYQ